MLDPNSGRNLSEILHYRALHQGDKTAFTFLPDERPPVSVNYHELNEQARLIARGLRTFVQPGERAVLLYPSGLEYVAAFWGCLCAGIVAVPVYPPRRNTNSDHLLAIVEDCQPQLILGVKSNGGDPGTLPQLNGSKTPRLLDTDRLTALAGPSMEGWEQREIPDESIAFLQYTSGSTSSPKGVMVSHSNLMHNVAAIQKRFKHSGETILVSWLPIYHDMGLIGNVLSTIYLGGHCVLMSPAAFVQQPVRWLDAVSRYRGTWCSAPNFAYDLCVEKVTDEQKKHLDLSSWRFAVNGAEPIRADTCKRFLAAFASAGLRKNVFCPAYGLAEGTLAVSCSKNAETGLSMAFDATELEHNRVVLASGTGEDNRCVLVSCGREMPDVKVAVVDPESLKRCAPDQVGEIWVSGASVCQGYWNKPQVSDSVFRAHIEGTGDGPFLRTGDLGFLHEEEVYVTGRLKDLIVIRGRNVYPQDIELTVEQSHPAIRPGCGAAFSIEAGGEERLVIVYEIKRSGNGQVGLAALAQQIRSAVAERHELDVFAIEFVKQGSIPKTSSGKIQRSRCRNNFLSGKLEGLRESEAITQTRGAGTFTVPGDHRPPMQFSLFYFSSNEAEFQKDKYRLFLEGAKFADDHEFSAVWIPERHFHPFGGIFPNPSVLASALAMTTKRIRIRAGSVVLPLHSPIRVAEEWSVVDNLSDGRVDLAFARGWNPNDFALAPANYQNSLQVLYRSLEDVKTLWRGDQVQVSNGRGEHAKIRIHPQPKQRVLPIWITCSGGTERFVEAGAGGWNVLTALLFQSVDELAKKIAAYREARARNGHDPGQGHVTLMLHTLLGTDQGEVKDTVRAPFLEYLKSSTDLWRHGSKALEELTANERQEALDFAFERYYRTSGLFGTPDTCAEMVELLQGAGVNEIACLIDFGVDTDRALRGLNALHWLQQKCREKEQSRSRTQRPSAADDVRTPERLEAHRTMPSQARDASPDASPGEDAELTEFICGAVANAISLATKTHLETIRRSSHFLSLGLNSLRAMEVVSAIEEQLNLRISYSMLFECPTVELLSQALVREHRSQLIARARAVPHLEV
jgi:natural product biosynthesis luciferase-like monooxygenase protein